MRTTSQAQMRSRLLRILAACLLFSGACTCRADLPSEGFAASLRAKYEALQDQLAHSQFDRPLYLESTQSPGQLRGDVYALVEYPFAMVAATAGRSTQWCEILLLHLNVKQCSAAVRAPASTLTTFVGGKHDQLSDAFRVEFVHRVAAESSDYLRVMLRAAKGPFGTRDYQIMLEAVPLPVGTFVHLSYSYEYGPAAAIAMRAYLNTVGRAKVGFTIIGRLSGGEPIHVGDVRGALERNVMRYFLALDAYLGASSAPPQERLEKCLRDWFAATERYPLQLRELPQDEYLEMKRREYQQLRLQSQTDSLHNVSAEGAGTVN
jgi:hypothetical protein